MIPNLLRPCVLLPRSLIFHAAAPSACLIRARIVCLMVFITEKNEKQLPIQRPSGGRQGGGVMGGPLSPRVLGRVRRQVVVGGDGGAEGRRLHVSRKLETAWWCVCFAIYISLRGCTQGFRVCFFCFCRSGTVVYHAVLTSRQSRGLVLIGTATASALHTRMYLCRKPFRQQKLTRLELFKRLTAAGRWHAHPPLALPSPPRLSLSIGTASTTPAGTATGTSGWFATGFGGRSTPPTCRPSSRSGTWLRCGARAPTSKGLGCRLGSGRCAFVVNDSPKMGGGGRGGE